jgi:type IV secretory pathway TrbL component
MLYPALQSFNYLSIIIFIYKSLFIYFSKGLLVGEVTGAFFVVNYIV